jgi:hypothetical protein
LTDTSTIKQLLKRITPHWEKYKVKIKNGSDRVFKTKLKTLVGLTTPLMITSINHGNRLSGLSWHGGIGKYEFSEDTEEFALCTKCGTHLEVEQFGFYN